MNISEKVHVEFKDGKTIVRLGIGHGAFGQVQLNLPTPDGFENTEKNQWESAAPEFPQAEQGQGIKHYLETLSANQAAKTAERERVVEAFVAAILENRMPDQAAK